MGAARVYDVRRLKEVRRLEPWRDSLRRRGRRGHGRQAAELDPTLGSGALGEDLADPERVSTDNRDILRRDPELAGRDLGERGFQPLPLRGHAGEDRDAPGGIGADGGALERADAGQFDIARDTEAE